MTDGGRFSFDLPNDQEELTSLSVGASRPQFNLPTFSLPSSSSNNNKRKNHGGRPIPVALVATAQPYHNVPPKKKKNTPVGTNNSPTYQTKNRFASIIKPPQTVYDHLKVQHEKQQEDKRRQAAAVESYDDNHDDALPPVNTPGFTNTLEDFLRASSNTFNIENRHPPLRPQSHSSGDPTGQVRYASVPIQDPFHSRILGRTSQSEILSSSASTPSASYSSINKPNLPKRSQSSLVRTNTSLKPPGVIASLFEQKMSKARVPVLMDEVGSTGPIDLPVQLKIHGNLFRYAQQKKKQQQQQQQPAMSSSSTFQKRRTNAAAAGSSGGRWQDVFAEASNTRPVVTAKPKVVSTAEVLKLRRQNMLLLDLLKGALETTLKEERKMPRKSARRTTTSEEEEIARVSARMAQSSSSSSRAKKMEKKKKRKNPLFRSEPIIVPLRTAVDVEDDSVFEIFPAQRLPGSQQKNALRINYE